MSIPRSVAAKYPWLLAAALISLFVVTPFPVNGFASKINAQQPSTTKVDNTARGIELYQKGDNIGAIEALRTAVKYQKDDAQAWLFLGLAYMRAGHAKKAREAFEKTVRLNPKSAEAHTNWAYTLLLSNKLKEAAREAESALNINSQIVEAHYILGMVRFRERERVNALKEAEAALKLNPDFLPALLLKSQALIGTFISESVFTKASITPRKEAEQIRWSRLKDAAEALEKYISKTPDAAEKEEWREQLEALRIYGEASGTADTGRNLFLFRDVTSKARILTKPEPDYTEAARRNGISGTVILLAVFAADGKVKHILALQFLPDGLTEKCINAARNIKFEPAVKDGRPVSTAVQIEYNFNLY
ncbi:MAG TPA: tetratricopeptide repeat protein [Pyrinomonadaceae bacterium]|jgi:Tfp pilus assembly protein PilF|nr:tetratricopeptide repeat protein [Pyrinomonadaceae bacterium]